jgi:hypothetical protein
MENALVNYINQLRVERLDLITIISDISEQVVLEFHATRTQVDINLNVIAKPLGPFHWVFSEEKERKERD